MKFLRLIPKKFLGVDIGTFAIKIVELSSWANRIKLENYGEISAAVLYKKPFRTFEKSTLLLSSTDIARAIRAILEEAKINTRQCVFSIPDFSTFFTTFELPKMTAEELPQAVRAEASKHVPLPLGEVILDWQLIGGKLADHQDSKLRILLVAVPNEVVNQYQKIASILNLKLIFLEAEVFGLARSLVGEDEKKIIGLIDIGARSTTCSIIEKGVLKTSRSFDVSGIALTERIAKGLSVDFKRAEVIKRGHGVLAIPRLSESESEERDVGEILIPLVDLIIRESEKTFRNFYWREKKEIKKIVLAGGTALLPGLLGHFQDYFKKETEIANPFSKIFYPPILEKTLKEMGPSYAIAVGAALRGVK